MKMLCTNTTWHLSTAVAYLFRRKKNYELGDDIFFLLSVYLRPEPIPMTGKVVWVTHKGSASFKQEGVGVQLSPEHEELKVDIEQALTGTVHSHKPTLTM